MERIDGFLGVEPELNGEISTNNTQNIDGYISEPEELVGSLSEEDGLDGELSQEQSLTGELSLTTVPVVKNDYEILINKPRIENVTLKGNKDFEDLGLRPLDLEDLLDVLI